MMNKNGIDVRRARLMNRAANSGFKLVVVLGDSPRVAYRVRVCVWSANQGRWSQPQAVSPDTLTPIAYNALSSRHRKVVDDAMKHIRQRQGVVSWGRGVFEVGDPWCADRRIKSKTAEGVTKLAPISVRVEGEVKDGKVTYSAASKKQLQDLNKTLSGWMFEGRK